MSNDLINEKHRKLADKLKKDLTFNGTGMEQSKKMVSKHLPDGLNMGHFNLACEYQHDLSVALPIAGAEAMVDEMVKDTNLQVLSSSFDIGFTTVDCVVRRDGKVVTPENKATGEAAVVTDVKGKVTTGITHKSPEMVGARKAIMAYANEAFKTK